MDKMIKEWKQKRDMIVAQMRVTFERESEGRASLRGITFESWCQMMAFRFAMLLEKDPSLWNFDLLEEYR